VKTKTLNGISINGKPLESGFLVVHWRLRLAGKRNHAKYLIYGCLL